MSDPEARPGCEYRVMLAQEVLRLAPAERQDTDARMLAYAVFLSAAAIAEAVGELSDQVGLLARILEEKKGG